MRTFDETRAPDDPSAHTSWVDLLTETERERDLRSKENADEYAIERIIRRRWNVDGTGHEYLVKWEGYEDERDQTWVPHSALVDTDALAAFEARAQTGDVRENDEEPTSDPERRMMYSIFNGLDDSCVGFTAAPSAWSHDPYRSAATTFTGSGGSAKVIGAAGSGWPTRHYIHKSALAGRQGPRIQRPGPNAQRQRTNWHHGSPDGNAPYAGCRALQAAAQN